MIPDFRSRMWSTKNRSLSRVLPRSNDEQDCQCFNHYAARLLTIPWKRQHEDEEPGPARGPPGHRITLSFSLGKDKSGSSGEMEA